MQHWGMIFIFLYRKSKWMISIHTHKEYVSTNWWNDVSSFQWNFRKIKIVRASRYYRLYLYVCDGVRQQLKTHNKNLQIHTTNGSISNMLQTCAEFLTRVSCGEVGILFWFDRAGKEDGATTISWVYLKIIHKVSYFIGPTLYELFLYAL